MRNPFDVSDERANGEGIVRRRNKTGEAGTVIIPEPTERPTESVKRCLNLLAPLAGAVAFEAQEGCNEFLMDGIEQGKQKGIDQHDYAKQLETRLQRPQAGTFQGQFAFGVAKTQFNGTITNDKFCLSRTGRLRLSWWRLPLSARETVTQAVEYPSEGTNVERCLREETHEETAMEGSALRSDKCRRSVSVGSELPVSCPVEHRGSLGPANGTFLSGEAR